jgi:hypothetical protein
VVCTKFGELLWGAVPVYRAYNHTSWALCSWNEDDVMATGFLRFPQEMSMQHTLYSSIGSYELLQLHRESVSSVH